MSTGNGKHDGSHAKPPAGRFNPAHISSSNRKPIDTVEADLREVLSAGYLPPAVTPPIPLSRPDATSPLGRSRASRGEGEADEQLAAVRQRALSNGVTAAICSLTTGVGATTISLLLAETLTQLLDCGVVVVETDASASSVDGSLYRAELLPPTVFDLVNAIDAIDSRAALGRYMTNLPGGAQLLSGPAQAASLDDIDRATFERLLAKLRSFYSIVLAPTRAPTPQAVATNPLIDLANAIVMVTGAEGSSLRQADAMLAALSATRSDIRRALVMNQVPAGCMRDVQSVIAAARSARDAHTSYCAFPEDRFLRKHRVGTELTGASLEPATQAALKDCATTLASGWF